MKNRFPKCEYWRLGNRFRLLWRDGTGKWCDTSVGDDGVVKSKSNVNKSGRVEVGIIGKFTGHPTPQGDPWYDGLLAFPGAAGAKEGYRPCTSLDMLKHARSQGARVHCEQGVGSQSHLSIVKFTTAENNTAEIWYDSTKNYMISGYITSVKYRGKLSKVSVIIDAFAQPAKGIYFPNKVVRTDSLDGVVTSRDILLIDGIAINSLKSESVLDLDFDPNISVVDSNRGVRYNSGFDGKQELNPARVASLGKSGSRFQASVPPASTEPSQGVVLRFSAYCFGLLLIVTFAILVIRKAKKKEVGK